MAYSPGHLACSSGAIQRMGMGPSERKPPLTRKGAPNLGAGFTHQANSYDDYIGVLRAMDGPRRQGSLAREKSGATLGRCTEHQRQPGLPAIPEVT